MNTITEIPGIWFDYAREIEEEMFRIGLKVEDPRWAVLAELNEARAELKAKTAIIVR
jgi:hypothetical protein